MKATIGIYINSCSGNDCEGELLGMKGRIMVTRRWMVKVDGARYGKLFPSLDSAKQWITDNGMELVNV